MTPARLLLGIIRGIGMQDHLVIWVQSHSLCRNLENLLQEAYDVHLALNSRPYKVDASGLSVCCLVDALQEVSGWCSEPRVVCELVFV